MRVSVNVRFLLRGTIVALVVIIGAGSVSPDPPSAVAQPSIADLDVTYIDRTPRQAMNCVSYPNIQGAQGTIRQPVLVACDPAYASNPEAEPHWPAPGSQVTFTGHIKNKGLAISAGGTYQWFIDEGSGEVAIGSPQPIPASALDPGGEGTVTYATTWDWPPEGPQVPGRPPGTTTHEYPNLRLQLTPASDDAYIINDQLTYYILGKGMFFFVGDDLYELFNTNQNGAMGTFSYEDWLQAQIRKMNEILINSVYPDTPDGSYERINLEQVYVAPTGTSGSQAALAWEQETGDKRNNIEGKWFQLGPGVPWIWSVIDGYDIALVHELGHQIGVIDIYNIPYGGLAPDCSHGIMGGGQSPGCGGFEPVHVLYLNKRLAYRAGFYGEFLYQKPDTNTLELKQANGQPLANAEVFIYQQAFKGTTAYPVGYGRTDAAGHLLLPDQPSVPITTLAGFSQGSANPFGDPNVVGSNAWLWFSVVTEDGASNAPLIFELTWPNVEAMAGRMDATYPIDTGLAPLPNGSGAPAFTSLTVTDGTEPYAPRFEATVSPDTDRVDFYIDGHIGASVSTPPFTFDWDTRYERPGKHWVSARAVKLSGGAITSYTLGPPATGVLVQPDGSLLADGVEDITSLWGPNIALNRPVSSFGVGNTHLLPRLTDGVFGPATWNDANVGDGDYIQIDLEAVQIVSGVRIHNWTNLADQCTAIEIYATVDPPTAGDQPVAFRPYYERTSTADFAIAPRDARYLRITCPARPRWVHIEEIEVFGLLGTTPTPTPTQVGAPTSTVTPTPTATPTQTSVPTFTPASTPPTPTTDGTVILRPYAQGAYAQWLIASPAQPHFLNVDEVVPDDDASQNNDQGWNRKDTQLYPSLGLSPFVLVESVTLKFRWKQYDNFTSVPNGPTMWALMRQSNIDTRGPTYSSTNADGWRNDEWILASNPRTGEPWTVDDINEGLEFGFEVYPTAGARSYITQIWVEVTVTPGLDTDGDGCSDLAEQQTAPGSETTGGLRDMNSFWDFYDVWTHPLANPLTWERNKVVVISDILAVAARFGPAPGGPPSEAAALAEALVEPVDDTSYHAGYDRGVVIGANSWDRSPPDGFITITEDILGVAAQFGHTCA